MKKNYYIQKNDIDPAIVAMAITRILLDHSKVFSKDAIHTRCNSDLNYCDEALCREDVLREYRKIEQEMKGLDINQWRR